MSILSLESSSSNDPSICSSCFWQRRPKSGLEIMIFITWHPYLKVYMFTKIIPGQSTFNRGWYSLFCLLLHVGIYALVVMTENFRLVLSLGGAISGSCIIQIFPAMYYLKIFNWRYNGLYNKCVWIILLLECAQKSRFPPTRFSQGGGRYLFLNFEHEIGYRNIHWQHRACDCPECCQSARQIRIVFKIIIALRLALWIVPWLAESYTWKRYKKINITTNKMKMDTISLHLDELIMQLWVIIMRHLNQHLDQIWKDHHQCSKHLEDTKSSYFYYE